MFSGGKRVSDHCQRGKWIDYYYWQQSKKQPRLSLLNWQHVKDYAGSDTCPLFYPPELHISYASSSKWCGSKGGMKEVERKLSGENLLCLCHDKLDQRCQDLGT